jgi:hypothetical protein
MSTMSIEHFQCFIVILICVTTQYHQIVDSLYLFLRAFLIALTNAESTYFSAVSNSLRKTIPFPNAFNKYRFLGPYGTFLSSILNCFFNC